MVARRQTVEGGFEALYAQTVDQALRGAGRRLSKRSTCSRKPILTQFQPENGAEYPNSRVGQRLQQVAQLHKADIGLEVAFVDTGGWDNHVNEGGVAGAALESSRAIWAKDWRRSPRTWATAWKTSWS